MIYAAKKTASMKKSSAKKAAAAAQLKATAGDDQYGEVPVDVPGASRTRPVRSRSEAYCPSEKSLRKQNTVDDVKSLNSEANVNANSMATFNSQEFDELSRMTGNSFIYCDAYKYVVSSSADLAVGFFYLELCFFLFSQGPRFI